MESNKVTRTNLINHLIKKHNLKRYLEIGVQVPEINFLKIECAHKTGVDPVLKTIHEKYGETTTQILGITSDEFFKDQFDLENNLMPCFYDCVFIDGMHTAEQVKKDFENALKVLSTNGFIVLHDCNPLKEEHTIVPRPTERGHWNGDVYKFALNLSVNENYKTVDIDNGCGVYHNTAPCVITDYNVDWVNFNESREVWLNLVSWDEFVKL